MNPRPMNTPPIAEEEVFQVAAGLPPRERAAYLDAACGADLALRARLERLLGSHDDSGFMQAPAAGHDPAVEAEMARLKPEEGGEMIGPYKLREQIGEGGFGTVWVADQEAPVRRRVALKIIKLGMDSKEVIARFEQERQALALMDHPNIAKILDAGVTQYGRPFFVMELVRGLKITDYCDEKQLSTDERIELFITVCQAVQHAHQKGIIHRDLKPSNILVTVNDGKAVPKVIDFGVAKATQGRLTDQTVYTQFQQMIGTPLYMSPEQAELTSLDIDTRSDIYALGVLLYELLTGHTPIDQDTLARMGLDEIRRIIREVDPPRPSARVKTLDGAEMTTAAKRRNTEPAKLSGTLRGDIDWIVMKCIEKDRARRYDTANGLALDLQRHLRNEVITARPPTAGYLLGKLMRRNKLAFSAGAGIAASLVIGIAASLWQAKRAQHEAARAGSAEQRALAALDELRATAPAFVEQARALAAKERFDEAIEKLDYALKLRPAAVEFLVAKGDLLQCQFKLAEAATQYRAALRVQPGLARAETSAKLCDELLAAPPNADGKLTRESLSKLHLAMQRQQRPTAELMPVARLLGEERKLIVDYWLVRLKNLPISTDQPLEKRLTVREDGLLALDLSATKIADLKALAGMPLGSLNLNGCEQITDGALLGEFRSLRSLNLANTGIGDLAPLRGLPLDTLDLESTKVFDLSPLRGMPLKKLSLRYTRIADLASLAGMPLNIFDATNIPASDYTPLAGAPLEECTIQNSPVSDLSFLRNSPVRQLCLYGCNELRGYSVLAGLKALDLLILPQSFRTLPEEELVAIGALRAHPTLKNIQTEYRSGGGWVINTTQSKELFWKDWDREQTFAPALRKSGFRFTYSKLPTGTYVLYLENQSVNDLSMLKGAPISELWLGACKITDLKPIQDLPLRVLGLWGNPVADLSPLRGMSLEELSLEGTKVSDLSPLTHLPLKKLYVHNCENLMDVSALAEIPTLEKLTVPMNARNVEVLRNLPNLKWLDFQADAKNREFPASTTQQFWERWPSLSWRRALNDAGMRYTAQQDSEKRWEVAVRVREFSDCSIFKGAQIGKLTLDGTSVTDLSPLAGLPLKTLHLYRGTVSDLAPLAGLALKELKVNETNVMDLSFLRRAPLCASLESLWLEKLKVSDFSPVAACPALRIFAAAGSLLADLAPLRGLRLQEIYIAGTKVRDLSVLAGMPLTVAYVDAPGILDVAPLLKCPSLEKVIIAKGAQDAEALAKLPKLQRIGYAYDEKVSGPSMTVAEFLADLPAQRAGDPLAKGRYAEAEPGLAEALAATRKRLAAGDPGILPAMLKLANCRAWAGHYREAVPLFREIIEIRSKNRGLVPDSAEMLDWYSLELMHAAAGDGESFRAVCTEMLHRCDGVTNDGIAERALQYCSIIPGGGIGEAQTRALMDTARPMDKTPIAYWFRLAVGLAEYRAGHFDSAAAALQKVEVLENSPSSAMADLVLAMISHRTGHDDDAAQRLQRCRTIVAAHWPLRQENTVDVRTWQNWLGAQTLLAEAEAVVAAPPAK